MLTKQTMEMTERERIAVQNSNNQFLQAISYVAVGTIFSYAGKTVPETFMLCDGRSLDKTEYEELFNVIGYTFGGSGDNFSLPNLCGKTLVGLDDKNDVFNKVGKTGGEAEHVLTTDEMPSHWHKVIAKWGGETCKIRPYQTNAGSGEQWALTSPDTFSEYEDGDVYAASEGEDKPHNNMPPYLVCNYIIKVTNSVMKDDFRFPIDQSYNPESENAQSGKAVAEAISSIEVPGGGNILIDQNFDPESENAQSGIAVAEAINEKLGDIETALDELHNYAQAIVGGV